MKSIDERAEDIVLAFELLANTFGKSEAGALLVRIRIWRERDGTPWEDFLQYFNSSEQCDRRSMVREVARLLKTPQTGKIA